MHDPTFTILACGFVAAWIMAGLAGWIRRSARRSYVHDNADALPPPLDSGKASAWWCRPVDLVVAGSVSLIFTSLALDAAAKGGGGDAVVEPNASSLIASIILQAVLTWIVIFSVRMRISPVSWLGLRWHNWRSLVVIGPASIVFMWLVFGLLQVSGYIEWMKSLGVETMQDSVRLLQRSADPQVLGLMVFAAVVVAPICEEIIFRGHLHAVLKRYCGLWPAAVASSLVFACAHGNLTAALPLFLFGLLLVLLYEKTGSLWAPMFSHFLFNGATVAVQLAVRKFGIDLPT
jgi:membrane protease YdiL (CAAX protease family)